ncbi:GntR family transcriptional regulator [Amycolatopsis sp. YIM 10]|uniref:GntR family transcriptional regulator n=1 Tax=Amycolatopsis sp. YIM 10 TaxID=2653857 RepID=UPI0012904FAB|nr:GntR family transcriptional regulator [Amycolatopsis sp. YIM 10]QFU92525.1 HTH-type transcriptional regulator McbR [Amycolatopsis sp. YIM 10]
MPSGKARAADPGRSSTEAVSRVVDGIKHLIMSGELLPGQQLRQEKMAATLGVSRLPVREGLRQLVADGLVTHEHNVGFAVARLSRSEFDQVYLMRRLLETEILRGLPVPTASQLARIAALSEEIERAAAEFDLARMRALNSEFHFAIFELSDQNLVVGEIRRIWTRALPYHSVYLHSDAGRERIVAEHREIVAALGRGDRERLVELMDTHRAGSEAQLDFVLQAGAARPFAG